MEIREAIERYIPFNEQETADKTLILDFLAKNAENIVKWLGAYCTLFCRADDYGIDRLDLYSSEQRRELV